MGLRLFSLNNLMRVNGYVSLYCHNKKTQHTYPIVEKVFLENIKQLADFKTEYKGYDVWEAEEYRIVAFKS